MVIESSFWVWQYVEEVLEKKTLGKFKNVLTLSILESVVRLRLMAGVGDSSASSKKRLQNEDQSFNIILPDLPEKNVAQRADSTYLFFLMRRPLRLFNPPSSGLLSLFSSLTAAGANGVDDVISFSVTAGVLGYKR